MSNQTFFDNPKNRFCWADCNEIGDGCEGSIKPVLVFGDDKPGLMDCGEDGMPFFYCDTAIESDKRTGYRVEIAEASHA